MSEISLNEDQLTCILYLWSRDARIDPGATSTYLGGHMVAFRDRRHSTGSFTDKERERACRELAQELLKEGL